MLNFLISFCNLKAYETLPGLQRGVVSLEHTLRGFLISNTAGFFARKPINF